MTCRNEGHDLLATAVTLRYNLDSDSNEQPNKGVSQLGNMLGFLVEAGEAIFSVFLLVVFLAFSAYVFYRFRKANISTIYIISELVVFGLFMTPCASLGAAAGNYLDKLLEINVLFTAVCALLGAIGGLYVWNQLR
jgi:uncharacterized membrane-anchored protein